MYRSLYSSNSSTASLPGMDACAPALVTGNAAAALANCTAAGKSFFSVMAMANAPQKSTSSGNSNNAKDNSSTVILQYEQMETI